jgi:hypothetical protein
MPTVPEVEHRHTELRRRRLVFAHQRADAQQRIDADLRHHREHRSHGRHRHGIRARQPKVQRPTAGFDQERDAENRTAGVEQRPLARRQRGESLREIGHVQRADVAVDHRDADQEQQRRREIHDDVVEPRAHARGADSS